MSRFTAAMGKKLTKKTTKRASPANSTSVSSILNGSELSGAVVGAKRAKVAEKGEESKKEVCDVMVCDTCQTALAKAKLNEDDQETWDKGDEKCDRCRGRKAKPKNELDIIFCQYCERFWPESAFISRMAKLQSNTMPQPSQSCRVRTN